MTDLSRQTSVKRRGFLGGLMLAATATATATTTARATERTDEAVGLDRAKWAPRNHAVMTRLIAEHGNTSPTYDPKKRPYAVFDWDNTSIMNDCEEALLMHQINTLSFKLTPAEFGAIIRQNVPPGKFSDEFKNASGSTVDLDSICADLDADYAWLHGAYKGLSGTQSLADVVKTSYFEDFRTKLYYLYEAVNDTHGVDVGYPWVVYLLANMTVPELSRLTEASNDLALGAGLVKTKYTSPADRAGKAGIVSVSHFHGIRLCTEIGGLMDTLSRHGIDTYVCTASLEHVVAVFATLPKYGYNVPREHVIGLRLEQDGETLKNAYRKGWPLTWGPGKTTAIKQVLVAQKGYGPLLVAGDSDGDYDMLRDFPDTRLGLVVNRMKKGKIGELSKIAADTVKEKSPRYVLQGRQESTGNWLPQESSIKLGKTEPQLLA
ncbi:haloacid dehalogenase-like hydrolase [Methylobacterium terricola]|uniref:phosphoserine phosphatase n=1 Tax=Methylobacterium terricola TaxID=2583531 RepID=A0A5C4LHP0_9HYPH|nr:haloacid dehalogenase-like hydrolase [Methylobacterium terricola]TNC12850.1 haloacid dehalogenase-like hydrolase [Methylobacterium terricola]